MQEEPETQQSDPAMNRHWPASEKSQDISHVLASIFKDLYTKDIIWSDTLSNLIKTKYGRSRYHERYVEELQQAQSVYHQCIKEADMLESHIIQARARAAAAEKQAYERMVEKMGDVADYQGLLTVESAFCWCMDNDLLKRHKLISPLDYLPQIESPAAIKCNRPKLTFGNSSDMAREPQGDSSTLITSPEKVVSERDKSDLSLTPKKKKTPGEKMNQSKLRPKCKGEPSVQDWTDGREQLQKPRDGQRFLRNPHLLPPIAQQVGGSLISPRIKVGKVENLRKRMEDESFSAALVPVFQAKPSVVSFTDYTVGNVYETTLQLQNLTSASRHVRVSPPTTPYFSVGQGRFPGEDGVIAPGMSCKYIVRFAPDSLGDYEDFITVETEVEHLLVVPIVATRAPPVLTLPRVLDCGFCLIGGVKCVEFQCQNVGFSAGTFWIIPKNQWPPSNLRSVVRTYFCEQPPFAIGPSQFALQPGEALVVEIVFFPTAVEKSSKVFTIMCDNSQVKDITIEGEGQQIDLDLVSPCEKKEPPVGGEALDLTAEHIVHFSRCNPHFVQQKKLIVRNNVHLELPFYWQIRKPNLRSLLPGETPKPSHIQFHLATHDAFQVSPVTGVLAPCQEQEFLLTFCPKELKDYHSVCNLVLSDVPQVPHVPPQPTDKSFLPGHTGPVVKDVTAMEIEVKGSTEPYQVLLEPYAIVIPGEVFIFTTIHRQFKMWNHSKTCIFFQWERMSGNSHTIEVMPRTGRIEENECFDFDLMVTGERPERVVTSLVCHIEHSHKSVTLPVKVSFKGPIVTVSVPSVDFGLIRLGEQGRASLCLTNITHLEASWMLKEMQHDTDTQISVEPRRGVLPPLASCSVDLLFMPRFCQRYQKELQLAVENGAESHLLVRGDVQSPLVCLLNCKLILSELYIGVPANATVTLINQTLLPSYFSWAAQLQGEHSKLCTASFEPSSGTLGPNKSLDITVNFISQGHLELTDVAALCEVEGMSSPLVLSILAPKAKKLSVLYSLPNVCSTPDDESPSTLLIDFGDDVILMRAVTKQLLITNQTAIPAPFTIEAEYFTCSASKSNGQPEKRSVYVKDPLHLAQAKKLEEKAHKEFTSSLLAHGKGAAFFVSPDSGMLGPFETQTVDVTAYTDMWGEYRDHLICKVGDLEATLVPMQMIVKGCPLYFQLTGPRPNCQNQGPIIQFGTHVSGGDTVARCLRINNPTEFDIRMDWETYNINPNDHQPINADSTDESSGALRISDGRVQAARERKETLDSEGTSVSAQSVNDGEGEESISKNVCTEENPCLNPLVVKKMHLSDNIRPHVGSLSDYPYCITPQQMVIPAKGSSTIRVSFTPLTLSESVFESRCVGLALGFMSLNTELAACVPGKVVRAQGLNLEPVRMDLLAGVKPAMLSVQMEDDERVLEFRASAGDLLKRESEQELVMCNFDVTQTLQLRNNIEKPLYFRLATQPPFSVLKPQPQARTSSSSNPGDSQCLVLNPQHSMQVNVAFHCSPSLLDHTDQADEEVMPGVTLIHSASGQRKLRFEQNLQIHYSNNSLQSVPLRAHLDLATMRLSTYSIDFGCCYVGQTLTAGVNLYSHGAHTYWKSLIDSRDSHVFRVDPEVGFLMYNKLLATGCRQCLQISFTPSEDKEFQSTVVIRSPLVKTPLTLQLQGTGSFDKAYKSDMTSPAAV